MTMSSVNLRKKTSVEQSMLEFSRINHENDSFHNRWWNFSRTTRAAEWRNRRNVRLQVDSGRKERLRNKLNWNLKRFLRNQIYSRLNSHLIQIWRQCVKNSRNTLNFHFSLLSSELARNNRHLMSISDVVGKQYSRGWWIMEKSDSTLVLRHHIPTSSRKAEISAD